MSLERANLETDRTNNVLNGLRDSAILGACSGARTTLSLRIEMDSAGRKRKVACTLDKRKR